MIRNYFTLYALAEEMSTRFTGGYVFELFTQEKNELRLALVAPDKKRFSVVGTTGETRLALYYAEDAERRRRNSTAMMSAANEKQIQRIRLSEFDRILFIDLEDNRSLAFQLFSADTNFFLLQKNPAGESLILEAFKKNIDHAGKRFHETSRINILRSLEHLANDEAAFLSALPAETLDIKTLPKYLPGFDTALSREAFARAGVSGAITADAQRHALYNAVSELFYELTSPSPIVFTSETDIGFSIVNETHRAAVQTEPLQTEPFESINEALRFYSFKRHHAEHFGKELKTLKKNIERLHAKTQAQLAALEEQSTKNRAAHYEMQGHLLLAHEFPNAKGEAVIVITNFLRNAEPETITLDIAKTIRQNAEVYFEKAKKARQTAQFGQVRIQETRQNLTEQSELLRGLNAVSDAKTFSVWRQTSSALLKKFLLVSKEEAEKQTLFKRFPIAEQIELWVGKNAKNNDLLTFKYAKPNDLWFHARGVSGSHCVLKSSRPPSRAELERAAAIAAYYSSAKGSDLVPVMYTPKKYVRKPKGALPGSVIVEREEVLIVKPAIDTGD
jgi:predicted ribosome quality control (RQC) complex YloA/Tae2 family protein